MKPFVIHTDACKIERGLGAVLLQQNFQNTTPTNSRKSNVHTQQPNMKLLMSLVMSIRHWAPYLKIAKFTVVVDHHALVVPLVKEHFSLYTMPNILEELVSDLLNKLKVKNNGSLTDKYLRAQALANLRTYGYIEHPPCVSGYKIPLKLTDSIPGHSKPQKLSQIESAFLQAQSHELLLTEKIQHSTGSL